MKILQIIKQLIKLFALQISCLFMLFIFGITYMMIVIFELLDINYEYACIISILAQYVFWIYQCYRIFNWNKIITQITLFVGIILVMSLVFIDIFKISTIVHIDNIIPFMQPEINMMLTMSLYLNTESVTLYLVIINVSGFYYKISRNKGKR